MGLSKTIWATPREYLRTHAPEHPVLFFSPAILQATARRFIKGFPGLVTYAVKSNPDEEVLANLVAAGVKGFDVASPVEMDTIARIAPGAAMHYNNPVRSRSEILHAVKMGVRSYSVDSHSELVKLGELLIRFVIQVFVRCAPRSDKNRIGESRLILHIHKAIAEEKRLHVIEMTLATINKLSVITPIFQ